MPFGLCNAPATFQRTMDLIFTQLRDTVGAYVDDVLIYTNTLQEHVELLRKVYEVLRKERFYANPDKCSHAQTMRQ